MAKKNKSNKQVFLSPEKYIKERGRKLEVFECWISKDWEKNKIAEIVIARKHTNGNISYCVYLVDLFCLGVKDSFFTHNQSQWQYNETMDSFIKDAEAEKVDYAVVHNVIHAAKEFAGDYKLLPCKSFREVTQYFLDVDTDAIPLIEIECGVSDEPSIIVGDENVIEARKTIAHFEKEFGKGVLKIEYIDGEYNEAEEGAEEEIPHVPYLPLVESLMYVSETDRLNDIEIAKERLKQEAKEELPENFIEYVEAVDRLFYNQVGYDKVEEIYNVFNKVFDVAIDDEFPDELLSFGKTLPAVKEENTKVLHDYYFYAKSEIDDWINEWPTQNHIPMVTLEIISVHLFANEIEKFDPYIEYLVDKHPDYYLAPFLSSLKEGNYTSSPYLQKLDEGKALNEVFGNARDIQFTEFLLICYAYYQYLTEKDVPEKIVVFWNYLCDGHQLEKTEYMEVFNLMAKHMYVRDNIIAKLN